MLMPYQTPPWRLQNWRTMPKEEYQAHQGRVLSRFIKDQVYPFSKHYRRVFDECGLKPEYIRSLDDLPKIPLTEKQDLLSTAENPDRPLEFVLVPPQVEELMSMTPEERVEQFWSALPAERYAFEQLAWEYLPVHANHTTGRSAAPTPVFFTRRDCYDYGEMCGRGGEFKPMDPLGVMLILLPFTAHAHQAFWYAPITQFCRGGRVIHTGGGKAAGTDTILQMVQYYKPQAIAIMPGYAFHFVRRAQEAGVRMENLQMLSVGGEKCTNEMRKKLHEAFVSVGADPANFSVMVNYGSTEFRGGFTECPTPPGDFSSSWYHVYPDFAIIEIVDPDTGEPVPEGETGEVVYTCLDMRGTVLLRYRTADIAVGGITYEPCRYCGCTIPRIGNELRRRSNIKDLKLTKLKGNLVDLGAFSPVLRGLSEVEEFQVELRKRNDDPFDVDQLIVHAAIKDGVSEQSAVQKIKTEIKKVSEAEPNDVVFHSLDEMLAMVGLETSLKEVRLVDNRPKESVI